jgi:hypothetical protein
MKKIILYTLLFIGANVLLFLLLIFIGQNFTKGSGEYNFDSLFFVFGSFAIALVLELIVGGIMAANAKTREIGKGLLLSAAAVLLFGLSVCSKM